MQGNSPNGPSWLTLREPEHLHPILFHFSPSSPKHNEVEGVVTLLQRAAVAKHELRRQHTAAAYTRGT